MLNSQLTFDSIYRNHLASVRTLLLRLGVHVADVDDVAQAVFLAAMRSLPTYDPTRGQLRPWLARIAKRHASRYRQSMRKACTTHDWGASEEIHTLAYRDAGTTSEDRLIHEEERQFLYETLAQMPQARREVFEYCALAGMTDSEVAEILRIPKGTVKSRLARAYEDIDAALKRRRASNPRRLGAQVVPISVAALVARERERLGRVPEHVQARIWDGLQRAMEEEQRVEQTISPTRPGQPSGTGRGITVRTVVLASAGSSVATALVVSLIAWMLLRSPPDREPPAAQGAPAPETLHMELAGRAGSAPLPSPSADPTVQALALLPPEGPRPDGSPPQPAPRLPPRGAPPAEADDEEARLFLSARAELQRGNTGAAIAILDHLAHEFPDGRLKSERDALRASLPR